MSTDAYAWLTEGDMPEKTTIVSKVLTIVGLNKVANDVLLDMGYLYVTLMATDSIAWRI